MTLTLEISPELEETRRAIAERRRADGPVRA
jgi:hypothetical protein